MMDKTSVPPCDGVSTGEWTPSEGAEISKLIDGFSNAVLARELERRLAKLEGKT